MKEGATLLSYLSAHFKQLVILLLLTLLPPLIMFCYARKRMLLKEPEKELSPVDAEAGVSLEALGYRIGLKIERMDGGAAYVNCGNKRCLLDDCEKMLEDASAPVGFFTLDNDDAGSSGAILLAFCPNEMKRAEWLAGSVIAGKILQGPAKEGQVLKGLAIVKDRVSMHQDVMGNRGVTKASRQNEFQTIVREHDDNLHHSR